MNGTGGDHWVIPAYRTFLNRTSVLKPKFLEHKAEVIEPAYDQLVRRRVVEPLPAGFRHGKPYRREHEIFIGCYRFGFPRHVGDVEPRKTVAEDGLIL